MLLFPRVSRNASSGRVFHGEWGNQVVHQFEHLFIFNKHNTHKTHFDCYIELQLLIMKNKCTFFSFLSFFFVCVHRFNHKNVNKHIPPLSTTTSTLN